MPYMKSLPPGRCVTIHSIPAFRRSAGIPSAAFTRGGRTVNVLPQFRPPAMCFDPSTVELHQALGQGARAA
jgi:hypothetical protein